MLVAGLISLLIIALGFVVWPLRCHRGWLVSVCSFIVLSSITMYYYWGGYTELQKVKQRAQQRLLAEQALKELKTPDAVISRLKDTLKKHPDSAKGWYLLGRIYASMGNAGAAQSAFTKAYRLEPKNLDIRLEYLQSLYIAHNGEQTAEIKLLLDNILSEQPNQPDALNFLAVDAYRHQDYAKAIKYWQRLLAILPRGSQEHQGILEALAKAQKKQQQRS